MSEVRAMVPITIIDYGTSNLGSIQSMLRKIGVSSIIASRPEDVEGARKIMLPGVGAFDAGMGKLHASGIIPALQRKVLEEKVPTLGVCLGMHLLTKGSEEGVLDGLGWITARTRRLGGQDEPDLRVPHMGWNVAEPKRQVPLLADFPSDARFYFAHSYGVVCEQDEDVILVAQYGKRAFAAGYQRGNIMGVQFHPEKSHRFGLWLLRNFVECY